MDRQRLIPQQITLEDLTHPINTPPSYTTGHMAARRRQHGLERPFHPLQIAAWCALAAMAASLALILPAYSPHPTLGLGSTCGILLLLTLISGLATSLLDPCDESVLKQAGLARKDGKEKVYCYICQANVQQGTAHCRICSKCVAGYDFHCTYLNTCVGAKNYLSFLFTLASALTLTTLEAGMTLLMLARWWGDRPHARESPFSLLPAKAYLVLILLIALASMALTLLLGQLLLFHLFLRCHHLTTYQYVLLQTQQQRTKEDKAAASRELVTMTSRHHLSQPEDLPPPPSLPSPPSTAAAAPAAVGAAATARSSNPYNTNVVLSPPLRPASLSSMWVFSPFSKRKSHAQPSLPGDVFLISDDEEDEDEDEDEDEEEVTIHF